MLNYKEFLQESFVNAIGVTALDKKKKYLDQVWDIIQSSYAPIGGIKGSGFEKKESMLDLPMWKMSIKDGKVNAVVLYKDKSGRKSVASATDGTEEGKKKAVEMYKADIFRSYGEKSKTALGILLKTIPENIIKQFMIEPKDVSKILKEDDIIPIKNYKGEIPEDAKLTISKYPYVNDYGYLRKLGKEYVFKVMIGTPGKTIK